MMDHDALEITAPGFVGGILDRADHVRNDPALLAQHFASTKAHLLAMDGLEAIEQDGVLVTGPLPEGALVESFALLGLDSDGAPLFVWLDPEPIVSNGTSNSWSLANRVPADQLALYGAARSLVDWHARHGFCAACGGKTQPMKAGWGRQCASCRAEHFPRVDPVVIMLAEHEGRILLGRQHRFPAGRYSALAGFVEPGETIEEAVIRELWEEAGIRTHSVRYIVSQPWPFPSSLMIACIAQADDDQLTLDETELEHAMWVDAQGVRAALTGAADAPFLAPPSIAVARNLLQHWVQEQGATSS